MLTNKKQTEVTVAETGFFENHETILPAANGLFCRRSVGLWASRVFFRSWAS
jgi:hypothetical protein